MNQVSDPNATDVNIVDPAHDPFAFGEIERSVPTTEAQREIWLAHSLSRDGSLAYSEVEELTLRGKLDLPALKQALMAVLQRHDALRSTISGDGQHLVVSTPEGAARLALAGIDSPASGSVELDSARRRAVLTQWDLLNGPLFRVELVRLDADHHVLLLAANHLVCDGWSWGVLLQDISSIYASLVQHATLPLDEDNQPFSDFALDPHSSEVPPESLHYWEHQFRDLPPPLELPLDRPRPARRSFTSTREDIELPAALLQDLRRMATTHGCSVFSLMLSAFGLLLGRISAQDDVVIGVPSAGQPWLGRPRMVGHCVHTLPIRLHQPPSEAFTSYLERANGALLDAMEHRACTLSMILRTLRMPRDPSRLPLTSILFNVDPVPKGLDSAFPGLTAATRTVARTEDNFELSLNGVPTETGMLLQCQFASDLFNAATVQRWLRAYLQLLRGIVAQPGAALGAYELVDEGMLQELAALQPKPTEYPDRLGMHQHFERSCDLAPTAIAVTDASGSQSYAELDAFANRIAHLLHSHGVRQGDLIGLAMDRGIPMMAALLGILKSGAGYIPLDPAFPRARLQHMLGDGAPRLVLTQQAHLAGLPLEGQEVVCVDEASVAGMPDIRLAGIDSNPDAIAYVIYTSGSTGKPKGVEITHRSVANFISSMRDAPGISADDVLVAVTTLSFDIAVLELMLPLSAGARVVIADKQSAADGELLINLLRRENATVMQATPATWHILIETGWQGHDRFRALCGGEAFPPQLAAQLLRRCAEVWNLYGPTETTVWSTRQRIRASDVLDISVGRPIANTQVWILDAGHQAALRGVPGELCIAGAGLARGYRNLAEMTAERFITWNGPDGPIRLYRTGDRARWREDDCLEHMGRLDFQVKVRGYRIELGEIESRLASHPDVHDVVVIVREDEPGDVRIVAYIIPEAGREPSVKDLKAHLRLDLPDYMIPQHVVSLDSWPLTANGKIDRLALPSPLLPSERGNGEPQTLSPLQADVLAAFRDILRQPQLQADDDFFVAGGHSLLAAQLVTRLNKGLGTSLSLRSVFDAPTARRLAEQVDSAAGMPGNAAANGIKALGTSIAPVSANQAFHLLLHEFHPASPALNLSSIHILQGPLDVGMFRKAFHTVLQRQRALRTTYEMRDGAWMQIVHEAPNDLLDHVVDLSHLARADALEVVYRDRARQWIQPMMLSSAPLFRTRLYRIAEDEHAWFFMPHHLNFDGWSFDLLYSEMAEAYAALHEKREHRLPELSVHVTDHAAWHSEWLKGPEYAAQRQHWKSIMAVPNARGAWPLALPSDNPRESARAGQSGTVHFRIEGDRLERMRSAMRGSAHTVNTLVCASLAIVIGHLLRDEDVAIGVPIRGRNTSETEPLIGDFVNLLPIRIDVSKSLDLSGILERTRDSLLGAFACPEIRLDDIAQMRASDPVARKSPLYHATISYQDVRSRPAMWGPLRHNRGRSMHAGVEDLSLGIIEERDGIGASLNYNQALFEHSTIQRLASRLLHTIERICETPSVRLHELWDELDALPPLERDAGAMAAQSSYNPYNERAAMDSREQYVIDLWKRHLRVEVAPDDNFFDLGGTSMLAMKMGDELARKTGFKLRLPELAVQSAAQLAAQLPTSTEEKGEGGWLKRMFKR